MRSQSITSIYAKILWMLLMLCVLISWQAAGQVLAPAIRINQIGYHPQAPKSAVVMDPVKATRFSVLTVDGKQEVYHGELSAIRTSAISNKKTRVADFTAYTQPGKYMLSIPSLGVSYPFEIRSSVYKPLAKAAIKGFYYQRLSTPLPIKYAGVWSRAASHPDNKVLVHASAATRQRPAGTVISSPRGWLDAGDYNKYVVNSGITVGTLLSAYEDYPSFFDSLSLQIPESNNAIPDLLDEVLWNIRWMLSMQDPNDGGVYHKLTNEKFDGMIMPDKANTTRYVVQKSTAATLDFAAVMAQASRVYSVFNPSLSDSCLKAAVNAWKWSIKNPAVQYDQNVLNKNFDPDITTGAYGDKDFADELFWAACELYATTVNEEYFRYVTTTKAAMQLPSWSQVRLLGYYTCIRRQASLPASHAAAIVEMKKEVLLFADKLLAGVSERAFNNVMGSSAADYIWGSSAVAANQGIELLQAYKITRQPKYLNGAQSNLDYLLGKNATGYSFVTGYGDKTPMHPHHRPSIADGVADPVPGLLVGGPNPGMQDKCKYGSSIADEAYADDACSYASNEIAINWNAPFVYLVGAIEALQK